MPTVPADRPHLSALPRPAEAEPSRPASLPRPLTSFVGREREVAAVCGLLQRADVRLVTLIGPGGVGKTRLAIRVAEDMTADFPDGVWFVSLAPVRDPALAAPTVAQVLGVRDTGGRPIEKGLAAFLGDREALLVLDNLEHLLDAAPLVTSLLTACANLKVLVTSRAVLSVSGEHDVAVPPLSLPMSEPTPGLDRLFASEAVRLFVGRASAARSDFAVTVTDAPTIAAICERLDGLPLAIELAAARVRALPPPALLTQVERRLALLTGGARDQPARLQTMGNAIAWSYDLLDPPQQRLFRGVAVFVGGFSLEAAQAVAAAVGFPDAVLVDGVASLVDHSLVQPAAGPAGEPRYRMLETVREFGLERLAASGEAAAVRGAHAAHFLAFAEANACGTGGPWRPDRLARLEGERPDLRAALGWFRDRGDGAALLRLVAALAGFWYTSGPYPEARAWLAAALAAPGGWSPARRDALVEAGAIAVRQGHVTAGAALAEEALAGAEAAGDLTGIGRALLVLSYAVNYGDDRGQAKALAERCLAAERAAHDVDWLPIALHRVGVECYLAGDLARAEALVGEAFALAREHDNLIERYNGPLVLGAIALARGDRVRAAAYCREVLAHRVLSAGEALALAANVLAASTGHGEQAARILGAGDALREVYGFVLQPFVGAWNGEAEAVARRALGSERFAAARETGRKLSPEQAVGEALAATTALAGEPDAAPALAAGLTPREHEILLLVAEGRSDREIADALFISPKTVGSHIGNILGKLGLPSRAAAVAYAHRHGLA